MSVVGCLRKSLTDMADQMDTDELDISQTISNWIALQLMDSVYWESRQMYSFRWKPVK